MRITFNKIFLITVTILSACCSCNKAPSTNMDSLLATVDTYPDSVMSVLQNVNINNLSEEKFAKYALAYSWALDKSGTDVSNDSLLRHAYIYYKKHKDDQFYARCMYYMGKYFSFVDSITHAELCFTLASESADRQKDFKTESFSYEKLSRLIAAHEPQKAEEYAIKAYDLYNKIDNRDSVNIVYLLLNAGNCSMFNNHKEQAKGKMYEALNISLLLNDSNTISASYQDLSALYDLCGQKDSSLHAIRKAFDYKSLPDISCRQALIDALLSNNLLDEAEEQLAILSPTTNMGRYTKLYKQHILAIKKKDEVKAVIYADSAYICLENMYLKEMNAKSKYFKDVIHETKKTADAQRTARYWAFAVLLAIIIIVFLLYTFVSHRRHALLKIKNEEEKNNLMLAHEQELNRKETEYLKSIHEKEISNRDIQLGVMRNYLLKRIAIAQKIELLKETTECSERLQDDDWKELEVFLNSVDNMFVSRIKKSYPQLNNKDVQLFMLLRLQIPTKRIADIYNISEKAIKQKLYLYKEKVGLRGEKTSLREFVKSF